GQLRLHLPVILHMTDLQQQQLNRVTVLQFLSDQVWMLGPALLLAIGGLVYLLRTHLQVLGFVSIATLLLLLMLHGKAYYLGPIYPTLLAAGAARLNLVPNKAPLPLRPSPQESCSLLV